MDRPVASEHLKEHLTAEQADVLDWLILPLSIADIAERMGPGYSRRYVEYRYHCIRDHLQLSHLQKGPLRVALVRLYYGLEPCWCHFDERSALVQSPRPATPHAGPRRGPYPRARQQGHPVAVLARRA